MEVGASLFPRDLSLLLLPALGSYQHGTIHVMDVCGAPVGRSEKYCSPSGNRQLLFMVPVCEDGEIFCHKNTGSSVNLLHLANHT